MSESNDRDERDRNAFSAFFTEHLDLPLEGHNAYVRDELRNDIEAWCEELDKFETLSHRLVKEVVSLIQNLEGSGARLQDVLSQLEIQLENLRSAKAADQVTLQILNPVMESLEQISRLRNGQRRFLEKLINRFVGRSKEKPWIEEHLQWRRDQFDNLVIGSRGGQSYEQLVKWVTAEKEKIEARTAASKGGAAVRRTPKGKVKKKYPKSILNAMQKIADQRSSLPPPRGLGSGFLEQPRTLKTDQPDDEEYPNGVRAATSLPKWNARLEPPWYVAKDVKGGMDMTSLKLWVRTDENNTILDRLMEKTVQFDSPFVFSHFSYWCGYTPVPGSNVNELLPMEWYTQALASSQPDSEYIIGIRSYPRISLERRTVRFYVEYAGLGDLWQVFSFFRRNNRFIPKRFLVLVFKALVDAALILKKGSTTHQVEGWQEIVHRDIKLPNIFLDSPQNDDFMLYPRPKLADFGHAFLTSEDDVANPALYNNKSGTPGWLAPEMIQFVDETTGEPVHDFPLLSHTNVWGIGAVMRCLMEREYQYGDDPETYLQVDIDNTLTYGPFENALRTQYSDWMCDAVEGCLAVNPEERLSLETLKAEIEAGIAQDFPPSPNFLAQLGGNAGLENARANVASRLGLNQDKYRIGLTFDSPAATLTEKEESKLTRRLKRW